MCRLEIDRCGAIGVERRLPTRDAYAPFVAWFESWKSPFRNRCHQVIAIKDGKIEKLLRHLYTDGVQSDVFRPGATKAVAIKSGHRIATAAFQFGAEHVRGHKQC